MARKRRLKKEVNPIMDSMPEIEQRIHLWIGWWTASGTFH